MAARTPTIAPAVCIPGLSAAGPAMSVCPQKPCASLWISWARLTQVIERIEIRAADRTGVSSGKHTPPHGMTKVFTSVNSPAFRSGTRIVSLFSFGVFSFVMMLTWATVMSLPLLPLP